MSKNNSVVPQARAALDQFKMEAAREVGVPLHIKKFVFYKNIINIIYRKPPLIYKGGFCFL
ncbi:MAG: alpha/beta-type small acid-soluble spore protein [Acutalibacteraceae bacterium]|nr:alpha/beta-type small acid-soluble spore protein [Acutalibacteraceae bacterium]